MVRKKYLCCWSIIQEWFVVRTRQKQLRETTHQSDNIKNHVQQLSHLYPLLEKVAYMYYNMYLVTIA